MKITVNEVGYILNAAKIAVSDHKSEFRVIDILKLLTHDKTEPYMDYVKRLAHDPDAKDIKKSDLEHNSKITRLKDVTKKDFDRIEKYHLAYKYLS